MSHKAKKQASSLPFSLSRWFNRISTMRPSSMLVTGIVVTVSVLLLSGIVYDIVNVPYPAIYTSNAAGQGRFYFLYPQLNEQFLFDTIASGILYAMGFIGLLAMYQSSKHAYNPRQAYMTLLVGASLLFIAYLFVEYFIRIKVTGA